MRTPHLDLKGLTNIFRFASDDETRSRSCEPKREPATQQRRARFARTQPLSPRHTPQSVSTGSTNT
jgi:hypothetical protein